MRSELDDAPRSSRDTLIAADENRVMFDRIARRYDLMNKIISLGLDGRWRERAIERLSPVSGGRYLDVGAGTGDLLLQIVKRAPEATGIGIDPSAAMLAVGRDKIRARGLEERIHLRTGDAMDLPFDDDTFDGVILGFAIRNVEDRQKALCEFKRVLKPGARLVILELTVPERPVSRLCHRLYTGTVVPTAARLLSIRTAYAYLVDSVRAFPRNQEFEAMMRTAGFEDAASEPLTLGTVSIFYGRADA